MILENPFLKVIPCLLLGISGMIPLEGSPLGYSFITRVGSHKVTLKRSNG